MSRIRPRHRWDVTPGEARALQLELAALVDATASIPSWNSIAAADVSCSRGETVLYAAVVVVHAATFELLERAAVVAPATFPYVPGLLSFREAPALLAAFALLKSTPDLVLCDGQGIAHPRSLGIASHLGLWLGIPTVGCAKSRLWGQHDEPGPRRGDRAPLTDHGKHIGTVLRTRDRVRPLFVSPGHLCDIESATRVVFDSLGPFRVPTPARLAHAYVNDVRRAAQAGQPIPT